MATMKAVTDARQALKVACGCYGSMTFQLCKHLVANIEAYALAVHVEACKTVSPSPVFPVPCGFKLGLHIEYCDIARRLIDGND